MRIAFDFDGVLASDESEKVYKATGGNMAEYFNHEQQRASEALELGPIGPLLQRISFFQKMEKKADSDSSNKRILKTAIIIARKALAHERGVSSLKFLGVEERARNWSMAIGLQDIDRLKPSEFLLEQAKANIEGKISSEEVSKRLEEYYSQKSIREKAEADGTFEADRVADRINLLLAEKAFTFSPMELSRIHGFLFKGVLPHAGQFRTYNITKNQWNLDGDTISYGNADSLSELLNYDFGGERKFDYSAVSSADAIRHIVRFISSI